MARKLGPGDLILLSGGLGSGKTTFIQGLAAGLAVDDIVSSPTFTLVSEYEGKAEAGPIRLHHIDLYRLEGEDDLYSIGLDELLEDRNAICAIEWPQRATSILPEAWLLIELEPVADTKRRIRFIGRGERYLDLVSELRAEAGRGR